MNSQAPSTSYCKLHLDSDDSAGQEIQALARLVKKALDEQCKLKKEISSASHNVEEKMRLMESSSHAELLARIQMLERQLEVKNEHMFHEIERKVQEKLDSIEQEMQVRLILALADKTKRQDPEVVSAKEDRDDRLGDHLSRLEGLLQEVLRKMDKGEAGAEAGKAHEGMTLALGQLQALFPRLQRLIRPSSNADAQKAQILFDHTRTLTDVLSSQLDAACASSGPRSTTMLVAEDLGRTDQYARGDQVECDSNDQDERQVVPNEDNKLQERLQKMRIELMRLK